MSAMAMASRYLFEPEFCNPASGWEKGQVEKNVQDARHRLWQPMPRFPSLEALNKSSDRTYGARRVWHDVLAEGLSCGLHRIERLMRENGRRAHLPAPREQQVRIDVVPPLHQRRRRPRLIALRHQPLLLFEGI